MPSRSSSSSTSLRPYSRENHSIPGGSSFVSHTPYDDHVIWKQLFKLLSYGYHTLIWNSELQLEVINLSNKLQSKLFLYADPYFLDLVWELFSLFPSSIDEFHHLLTEIRYLDPVLHEAEAIGTRILRESSQLVLLRKEYNWADQISTHLQLDINTATDICDLLSELISEQGESSELEYKLVQAELSAKNISDRFRERVEEAEALARIIRTKTYRLADLEMRRTELQHKMDYHTYLVRNIRTLETTLKIFVAKIGAYFHFM